MPRAPRRRPLALRIVHSLRFPLPGRAAVRRRLFIFVACGGLAAGLTAGWPGDGEGGPGAHPVAEAAPAPSAPFDPGAGGIDRGASFRLRVPDPSLRVQPPLRRRLPRPAPPPEDLPTAAPQRARTSLPPQTNDLPIAPRGDADRARAGLAAIGDAGVLALVPGAGVGTLAYASGSRAAAPPPSARANEAVSAASPAAARPDRDATVAASPAPAPASPGSDAAAAPARELAAPQATGDTVDVDPVSDPSVATASGPRDDVHGLSQEIEVMAARPDAATPGPGLDPPAGPLEPPAADHAIAKLLGAGDEASAAWPSGVASAAEKVLENLGIATQGQPEALPPVAAVPPDTGASPGGKSEDAKGAPETASAPGAGSEHAAFDSSKGLPVDVPSPAFAMASRSRGVSASGSPTPVPEPSAGALLLLGLFGLGVRSRRRRPVRPALRTRC